MCDLRLSTWMGFVHSCPGSSLLPGSINTSATTVNILSSTMVHFITLGRVKSHMLATMGWHLL
jgi:hypothetical protein